MARKPKGGRPRQKPSATVPERYKPGLVRSLDQRTAIAQQLRNNFVAIVDDIGGEHELSHIKSCLIERFVHLEAVLVQMEADLKKPESSPDVIGKWIQACNSLQGLAKTLGIERKAKDVWANVLPSPVAPPAPSVDSPVDSSSETAP